MHSLIKSLKPVLIDSNIRSNIFLCHGDYIQYDKDLGENYDKTCIDYKDLILIDLDNEDISHDQYRLFISNNGLIDCIIEPGILIKTIGTYFAIRAITNNYDDLPKLSKQSIDKLVNYYNEHQKLPTQVYVKVKRTANLLYRGSYLSIKTNKKGNVKILL